jgi:hypothetical protein
MSVLCHRLKTLTWSVEATKSAVDGEARKSTRETPLHKLAQRQSSGSKSQDLAAVIILRHHTLGISHEMRLKLGARRDREKRQLDAGNSRTTNRKFIACKGPSSKIKGEICVT